MRILFLNDFIPPRHVGGPGKRNFETAVKLKDLGHDVFFITSCQKKEQEIEDEKLGVKIFNVYSDYPLYLRDYFNIYNPKVMKKVKKIMKEIHPDVVHVDTVHTYLSYACLKIARKFSKAVFLHSRDFMLFNYGKFLQKERECGRVDYKVSWFDNLKKGGKRFNPFRNFLIKRYLKYVDKIFAISDELAKALLQNGITNVAVLHNGFPLYEKEPEFCELESKKILLSGRLNEAKGVYALLDAFPLIKLKIPEAKIVLVGVDGEEKKRIDYYVLKNRLGKEDIEISGWIPGEQMYSILKSAAVVCSPSLYPDPLLAGSNYEAASFKKPVITTCFGGAKEFVLDGKTGYVVNPFKKEELADRVVDLLSDEEKARRFGEAAYLRLKTDFSLDEYAKKLLDWYGSFLKNN
ncbi:MAG: glycosyltransferase family 4 protein [Candidatus Pacebacteria bacterium]|nr:glycosyltransferase family 4 protein [Candidatus Paceibacterota bacterium]